MISIAVNQREKQHSFVRYSKSGYHINSPLKLDSKKILFNFNKMTDVKNRKLFVENMKKADLLHGIDRVSEKINKLSSTN